MEYSMQMLNMDEVHFVSYKKKELFKLKTHIWPYIINTKVAAKEIEEILSHMKFKHNFSWSYDPQVIISKLILEQKSTPYAHTSRPEIEQYANQEEFIEGTLQEAEEQLVRQSSMQTQIPKEKEQKREENICPL